MKKLPEGPLGNLFDGCSTAFREDPLGFLTESAAKYGDFVPFRFGVFPAVLVCHPDLIQEVLVTKADSFTKDAALHTNRLFFGNGLLSSEGELWRRQRKLASPAFSPRQIQAYGEFMLEHTLRMLDRWNALETIDVQEEMVSLTLAIVVKTLFDVELTDDAKRLFHLLTEAQECLSERMNSALLSVLPEWMPFDVNVRLAKAVKQLDQVIYKIIRQRRKQGTDRADLLSKLLAATEESGAGGMSDRQVRDEVLTLFFAGHETTALTLTWIFYLISQHPEVEARLHEELKTVLQGRLPRFDDLQLLTYTEKIVREAMRVYPPVWAIGREARRTCEIGGYQVLRGTAVICSQWVNHHDSRYFPEPMRFNPDRWTEEFTQTLPKFAYYPFGGGPRICIGNTFAMVEAVLILSAVAQRFRLTLVPGQPPIEPFPVVTLRPKMPVKMNLVKLECEAELTPVTGRV